MFDDVIVVYKFIGDLMFFVTGSQDENELILYQVLQGFYEAISLLLRYPPFFISSCETPHHRTCGYGTRVVPHRRVMAHECLLCSHGLALQRRCACISGLSAMFISTGAGVCKGWWYAMGHPA